MIFSAYELYADLESGKPSVTQVGQTESQDVSMAQRFKNAFSHKVVKVHFVGAWCVMFCLYARISLLMAGQGHRLIYWHCTWEKMLPGTVDGMTHVCYFRHALALDERRVKFLPEYAYGGTSISQEKDDDSNMHKKDVVDVKHPQENGSSQSQVVKRLTEKWPQTMEVWFAGTHSDM